MADEWQEGETRQIDGMEVTLAAECTPDSGCCGAELEKVDGQYCCVDCGEPYSDDTPYGEPPERIGEVPQ